MHRVHGLTTGIYL